MVEEDEVSDAGSGQGAGGDADAEPAEEENRPDVQVVRLEGVPDVRVVGDSSGVPRLLVLNPATRPRPSAATALPVESLPRPKARRMRVSRLRIKMRPRVSLPGAMKARASRLEIFSRKKWRSTRR